MNESNAKALLFLFKILAKLACAENFKQKKLSFSKLSFQTL
jgi:hypothetical protein